MKSLFYSNNFLAGLLTSVLLNGLCAGILALGLWLMQMDTLLNLKIFIFSVVPNIFLLRYYATNQLSKSMRGCVVSLVVCLGLILICLSRMNIFDGAFNWKLGI